MKKILIIHSNMDIGGAETSLLGLLQNIDYNEYAVDLFLLNAKGELLTLLPSKVKLLETPECYRMMTLYIKDVLKKGHFMIAGARILGRVIGEFYIKKAYIIKQLSFYFALPFLKKIDKEYDMAISFIDPHFVLGRKVKAKVKVGWFHTDYSEIVCNRRLDVKMWNECDYIVNVSDSCKKAFDKRYPELKNKSYVVENILSKDFLHWRANEFDVKNEMEIDGAIRLLSIGRFSTQKNFDNIPNICKRVRERGVNVRWYIIGYGGEEEIIRKNIIKEKMEEYVIILGKKENPYPYIKACDVYVQPSRFEGKAVAVREAQILNKPVIITNYSTAASQLTDGYDGVIVPLDNEECARHIERVLKDGDLLRYVSENTLKEDYTNVNEIKKIYSFLEDV